MNTQKIKQVRDYIDESVKDPLLTDYKEKLISILKLVNFTNTCEPNIDNDIIKNQGLIDVAILKSDIHDLCISLLELSNIKDPWEIDDKVNHIKNTIDYIIDDKLIKNFLESNKNDIEKESELDKISKLKFRKNKKGEPYILAYLIDWTKAILFERNLHWISMLEFQKKLNWITLNKENRANWWNLIKSLKIDKNSDDSKSGLLDLTINSLIWNIW